MNKFIKIYIMLMVIMASILAALIIVANQHPEIEEEQFEQIDEPVIKENDKIAPQPIQAVSQPKLINDGYVQTLTKSMGVNYYNGVRETYYSSQVLKHYRIDEWWNDDNGFWRDSDGYFILSSSDYAQGSVVSFSQGLGKIYDCGCPSGVLDIYVSW